MGFIFVLFKVVIPRFEALGLITTHTLKLIGLRRLPSVPGHKTELQRHPVYTVIYRNAYASINVSRYLILKTLYLFYDFPDKH